MNKPFFSIVIATRNRHALVQNCILSLKWQTFKNFEVILSDNSDPEIQASNEKFVNNLNFKNLKYVKTNKFLNMAENYNFGLSHATGKYVGVMTDKTMFKVSALDALYQYLNKHEVDIINYAHNSCQWHSTNKLFKWFTPFSHEEETFFKEFNPKEELSRRFSCATKRSLEGNLYNYGKIFFGFYNSNMIKKIMNNHQKLFWPISPDYTSTALALHYAKEAVFFNKKILLAIDNYAGNGRMTTTQPGSYLKFIKTCTDNVDKLFSELPISNIPVSTHNFCAYDYQILNRFGITEYKINLDNLAERVSEELVNFPYESDEIKQSTMFHFSEFLKKNNVNIELSKNNTHEKYSKIDSYKRFFTQNGKIKKIKKRWCEFSAVKHYRYLHSMLSS
jgi:glycosyltransferase involved in cell wall biosynthesis